MDAITGMTGQAGGATARHFPDRGQRMRAVVGDGSKAAARAAPGADIADRSDSQALAATFDGVDGVFAMLPTHFVPGHEPGRIPLAYLADALVSTRHDVVESAP